MLTTIDFLSQLLKLLNSNTENPYLLWDNGTRAELLEFLQDQQQQTIKKVGPPSPRFLSCHLSQAFSHSLQGECDPAMGADFTYTAHSKELVVGEIFVRVYNEQPTFPLEVSCHQVTLMTF